MLSSTETPNSPMTSRTPNVGVGKYTGRCRTRPSARLKSALRAGFGPTMFTGPDRSSRSSRKTTADDPVPQRDPGHPGATAPDVPAEEGVEDERQDPQDHRLAVEHQAGAQPHHPCARVLGPAGRGLPGHAELRQEAGAGRGILVDRRVARVAVVVHAGRVEQDRRPLVGRERRQRRHDGLRCHEAAACAPRPCTPRSSAGRRLRHRRG